MQRLYYYRTNRLRKKLNWFPRDMTPEKRVQKFHTDNASLPTSGSCFWLSHSVKQISLAARPIRTTTKICASSTKVISQGNQRVSSWNVGRFLRLVKNPYLFLLVSAPVCLDKICLFPHTSSPDWYTYTSFKNKLRDYNIRSRHFPLGYHFFLIFVLSASANNWSARHRQITILCSPSSSNC